MIPKDMKFTKSHEWARVEAGTKIATVGITDFAVQQLGDVVFLELPPVGKVVAQGKSLGVIESVKAAVELYSPLSGEVVEVNKTLADNFDMLKEDAYGGAWMIKVKASDLEQLESLMGADEYEKYIQGPECKH